MLMARAQHTVTALDDGRVLAVGGLDRFGHEIAECELYDPNTGTWSTTAHYYIQTAYHRAVRLLDGRVLVVPDLKSPQIYDPITAAWSGAGGASFQRREETLTLLGDGRVIMVGGAVGGRYGEPGVDL